jgi:TPR repeat protein
MSERLGLYKARTPYTEPWPEPEAPKEDKFAGTANPDLVYRAASGSAEAQFQLAAFYLSNNIHEIGDIKNPGMLWMKRAAESGHAMAANEVGRCYLLGEFGCPLDGAAAEYWLELAYERGDELGAFNLGYMYAHAFATKRDDVKSTRWLTIAAAEGIAAAAFLVAFRYGEGIGAPADAKMKEKYLAQAAAAGLTPIEYTVSDPFASPIFILVMGPLLARVDPTPNQLGATLVDIADDIREQLNNGSNRITMPFGGDNEMQLAAADGPAMVFDLVRIAAQLGSADAQLRLANMYDTGYYASQWPEEAAYWRDRANRLTDHE